jgi:hypothetical protein
LFGVLGAEEAFGERKGRRGKVRDGDSASEAISCGDDIVKQRLQWQRYPRNDGRLRTVAISARVCLA